MSTQSDVPQQASSKRGRLHRYTSARFKATQGLLALDWVQKLLAKDNTTPALTAGALASGDSQLPADHMFTAFLSLGLVNDMLCLYSADTQLYHTIVTLGENVCGHAKIVHGGFTAAVMDETLGGLNYVLKREGVLGSGPSFTVHLEVDYKKPIPAESTIICTAGLKSIEGRKAWVFATVQDKEDGEQVYATGKALFVIPRDAATADQKKQQNTAAISNSAGNASTSVGAQAVGKSMAELTISK